MKEEVYYQNTDVLLMDPCYSREYDFDIDSELYCSDLIIDIFADGYYYVVKGRIDDMMEKLDKIAEEPEKYAIGELTVDSVRIGVYDFQKAIQEQPALKEKIEKKEIIAAVIRNFTGTITSVIDDDHDVYVVGKSDDGENDFFVIEL